jgi:NOL1/NOP2/fmu family ribosome biogenesis protein
MAAYIHGDVVPSTQKGWTLVTAGNLSIGWGKGDGKILKNHYPKGLRR